MGLLYRWRALSLDWRLALAYGLGICLLLGLDVLVGPPFLFLACFGFLVAVVCYLGLLYRFVLCSERRKGLLPFLLVSVCLGSYWKVQPHVVDLHLINRVYLAGGPHHINQWAQILIKEQQGNSNLSWVESKAIPPGVREHLPGHVSVGGTLWSNVPRLRIELGGGFYHYGIVVFPTEAVGPPEWWQEFLGWPAEVRIYHEE